MTQIGIQGLTVSEAPGFGKQRGQTEIYRGAEYEITFVPKTRIKVAVPGEMLGKALGVLQQAVATEQIGDGGNFCL